MKKLVGSAVIAAAMATCAATASASGPNYGAIALSSSTGLIGYSYDYTELAGAKARALRGCGAADCELVVWFANGCGAVAYSGRTRTYSWAFATSRGRAQSQALSDNYSDAYIAHWNCTSNHG